jgi:hypothetical protein
MGRQPVGAVIERRRDALVDMLAQPIGHLDRPICPSLIAQIAASKQGGGWPPADAGCFGVSAARGRVVRLCGNPRLCTAPTCWSPCPRLREHGRPPHVGVPHGSDRSDGSDPSDPSEAFWGLQVAANGERERCLPRPSPSGPRGRRRRRRA